MSALKSNLTNPYDLETSMLNFPRRSDMDSREAIEGHPYGVSVYDESVELKTPVRNFLIATDSQVVGMNGFILLYADTRIVCLSDAFDVYSKRDMDCRRC